MDKLPRAEYSTPLPVTLKVIEVIADRTSDEPLYQQVNKAVDYDGSEVFVLLMVHKYWAGGTYPLFFLTVPDHGLQRADSSLITAYQAALIIRQATAGGECTDPTMSRVLAEAVKQMEKE